jgi:hypothetical protein
MELIKIDGRYYTSARELHQDLGIRKPFTQWFEANKERAMLSKSDFITSRLKSTGGRPGLEFYLNERSAIAFVILSGGQFAYQVRKKLIDLYDKHKAGLAFEASQIEALMDLSKSMCLVSIQQKVERKHFIIYNDKYSWYEYRAQLLGYSTKDIIEAMKQVNKKHKSIRKSLIKLDSCELIRTGIIDLMKCLGKTDEYAQNVGNLCKKMASKMELGNIIWDDTIENPLKINSGFESECKQSLNEYKELK